MAVPQRDGGRFLDSATVMRRRGHGMLEGGAGTTARCKLRLASQSMLQYPMGSDASNLHAGFRVKLRDGWEHELNGGSVSLPHWTCCGGAWR